MWGCNGHALSVKSHGYSDLHGKSYVFAVPIATYRHFSHVWGSKRWRHRAIRFPRTKIMVLTLSIFAGYGPGIRFTPELWSNGRKGWRTWWEPMVRTDSVFRRSRSINIIFRGFGVSREGKVRKLTMGNPPQTIGELPIHAKAVNLVIPLRAQLKFSLLSWQREESTRKPTILYISWWLCFGSFFVVCKHSGTCSTPTD